MRTNKPADHPSRALAVDPKLSVLVQAPAGSGKTTLLTERFLALLARVNDPGEIVAITFTNAAAAEMRNRVLEELERAEQEAQGGARQHRPATELAKQAWQHAEAMGWMLLDQPAQLRIMTIDSFCRQLALQQPLLSSLGGQLRTVENPQKLYLEAARRTLKQIEQGGDELGDALRLLFEWRDNQWRALEEELVRMLAVRDKWLQPFLFEEEFDEERLRQALEMPFIDAIRAPMRLLREDFRRHSGLIQQALALAAFADSNLEMPKWRQIAVLPALLEEVNKEASAEQLEEVLIAMRQLSRLLLNSDGNFRSRWTAADGFPTTAKAEKLRIQALIENFKKVEGLERNLAAVHNLPTPRYTEQEWQTIRACFIVLRRAAAHLNVVFAESGSVDFQDVAHQALNIFDAGNSAAAEAAFAVADGILHLLVDEFQDTSRSQYKLLGCIIDQWSDAEDRSVFVVGDPMQSIYLFRNAEAELFHRTRKSGLDLPSGGSRSFLSAPLTANFRTQCRLVDRLNAIFTAIASNGSEKHFAPADAAREEEPAFAGDGFYPHIGFMPEPPRSASAEEKQSALRQQRQLHQKQIDDIVQLCRGYEPHIAKAQAAGKKFRIAILGRTRKNLTPIAAALREVGICYRAVELESLTDRPEVLDALALAKALLNPEDRLNWLGVLRAPWCGLPLAELHLLVSADDEQLLRLPVPQLIAERMHLLPTESQRHIARVLSALEFSRAAKTQNPAISLGTWLEAVWLHLGGAHTVAAEQRDNLGMLWTALDNLKNGEADLLSPALDAVLSELKAQPDPTSSTQLGVHLMTIHKAKGLEFEIVIVPEMQSPSRMGNSDMLAWLERGTLEAEQVPSEFLVAARQPKGGERSSNKAWVDSVIRAREREEIARLFYVACTRAREELHLFTRILYRDQAGELQLVAPRESLLKTAYPALEKLIIAEFAHWRTASCANSDDRLELAASAEIIDFPAAKTNQSESAFHLPIRRINPKCIAATVSQSPAPESSTPIRAELYQRRPGSLESRLLGRTIHSLLESFARLHSTSDWSTIKNSIPQLRSPLIAGLRVQGLNMNEASALMRQAEAAALAAISSPLGQWILDPHPSAASEPRWTGLIDGELRQIRPDRIFLAGQSPLTRASETHTPVWWIIDYKSAHLSKQFSTGERSELRHHYAPQLELYGHCLRALIGDSAIINLGLFYPAAAQLDYWEMKFPAADLSAL